MQCGVWSVCAVWSVQCERTTVTNRRNPEKPIAIAGVLIVEGEPGQTRNIRSWLRPSLFEETQRAPIPEPLPTAFA